MHVASWLTNADSCWSNNISIYCHEQYGETVSINRVRQLRSNIRNEAADDAIFVGLSPPDFVDLNFNMHANT